MFGLNKAIREGTKEGMDKYFASDNYKTLIRETREKIKLQMIDAEKKGMQKAARIARNLNVLDVYGVFEAVPHRATQDQIADAIEKEAKNLK